jgi:thiol-disulfide isomerase/thioredoxin
MPLECALASRRLACALSVGALAAAALLGGAESVSAQSGCSTSAQSSCQAPGTSGSEAKALIGSPPPTTTGKDLTGSGTLTLSSLLGEPTAVVFWLNSCPHCQQALPAVNRLSAHLKSARVVTAAIDAGVKGPKGFETPAAAVKTLRLRAPTILVANDVAKNEWHVATTPTAYIIDSAGVITQVLQPKLAEHLAGDIRSALSATS